ncbi:hypothetical protein AB3X91_30840 [Paraburkholderia sp. BR14263]
MNELEWQVLDILRGITEGVTPLARHFADMLLADPRTDRGKAVADVLATERSIYFWLRDGDELGEQHELVLPHAAELKLAA